jgi:subtilisin family serine protease
MLMNASHGTHVAGTIVDFSDAKAELYCFTHGWYRASETPVMLDTMGKADLAGECATYGEFLTKVVIEGRERSLRVGKHVSGYLKSIGGGVVNGSWGRPMGNFEVAAERLEEIYRLHGKNPESIDSLGNVEGLDLVDDLPLELAVADAALFALIIHENPDVLFVVAAGNSSENNDETLPSPNYLSQFFPNMITIASHGDNGVMSSFSCYGPTSVQLAARGEAVHSALLSGAEGNMHGTSMASPSVAGVAALIRANHPKLKAADVRRILEATAAPHESFKGKIATEGIMDKDAAVKLAANWSSANVAQLCRRRRS